MTREKAPWRRLRNRGQSILTPSELDVLRVVLDINRERPGGIRVRDLSRRMGTNSTNWIHTCLRTLRDHGLVSYENHRGRTLVPTCRFISAGRL